MQLEKFHAIPIIKTNINCKVGLIRFLIIIFGHLKMLNFLRFPVRCDKNKGVEEKN